MGLHATQKGRNPRPARAGGSITTRKNIMFMDNDRPPGPPVQQVPKVSWSATHQFVAALELAPWLPIAGTDEWCTADDAVKFQSMVLAGDRWALEQEMLQIQQRRYLAKLSAIEIAEAKDWTAVARQLRDRDAFLRDHSDWAVRRSA